MINGMNRGKTLPGKFFWIHIFEDMREFTGLFLLVALGSLARFPGFSLISKLNSVV